jgi:thymidylate synthase (FAD)
MTFDVKSHFKKIDVLDRGYVELIDGMVGDPRLKIVNAARVSFNKESQELSDRDMRLIKFLREHGHLSTFRHSYFTFRIKAPLCVFRQWWKYQIGADWVEDELAGSGSIEVPSTSWNEASGRYVEFSPEFYIPQHIRFQSSNNKQGSYGDANAVFVRDVPARDFFEQSCMKQYESYLDMVSLGLAKEQARMLLPQNIYSECILTQSLQSILFFLEQRLKEDAQFEIRQYAAAIQQLIEPMFAGLDLR